MRLSALAPLVLFAVFACCVVIVLLFGADIYQGLAQRDRESYQRRTAVQYLTTKVHQAENGNAVAVSSFGDGDSLVIAETIHNLPFRTEIYCHEGWLMELFTAAGAGLTPADGSKVLPATHFTARQEGTLHHLTVDDQTFTLHLRGQEVTP